MVKRLIVGTMVALTALVVGVVWSSALAAKQRRQRDAQHLTARGHLAFDIDRNPLQALALGVAALRRHDLVEASDMIAGVLPHARRPRGEAKVGAFATRPMFSARGRYLAVRSQAGDRSVKQQRLTVLSVPALTETMRVERPAIAAAAISPDERAVAAADGGPCVSLLSVDGRAVTCVAHAAYT